MEENFDIRKISHNIVNMIDDHFLVCNQEGRIVFSNEVVQSYLGYTGTELKHKNFIDIIGEIYINKAKFFFSNVTDKPSLWAEFLCKGKNDELKLHFKGFKKDGLIYIYGNEKYVEYDRMKKKLDVEIANAIKIHRRSLPVKLPSTKDISFASLYIPAEELGGDLFDVFKVDNGLLNDYFEQYVCFIADVSGHGLDSAMLAIFIKDTIRSYFRLKHINGQLVLPKEIMDFFVEQYIKEGYPGEYLVCMFLVVFDVKTNELIYCNAGFHKCPVLIREGEGVLELDNGGLPISTAIDADLLNYNDCTLDMSSEMTLFVMSDGLPEQRVKNEFYEDRLKNLFTEIYHLTPVEIIGRIKEDFTDFLENEKNKDDITLVVVQSSKQ